MEKKRIVITGASGLLGGNLCYLLNRSQIGQVTATVHHNKLRIPGVETVSMEEFIMDPGSVDILIHCAAMTNVDECEKKPKQAYEANVALTEQLISIANRKKALMIYISTDAVYKDSDLPKNEDSEIKAINVYADSKIRAEQSVLSGSDRYYIIRTNLFGFNILDKLSLAEWIMKSLQGSQKIKGFVDVVFSPILVNSLADALIALIISDPSNENDIFNIGATTSMSKFSFGCEIANAFLLNKDLIEPASVKDFDFLAGRQQNSAMNSEKFIQKTGFELPGLPEHIIKFKELYDVGYPQVLKSFNL